MLAGPRLLKRRVWGTKNRALLRNKGWRTHPPEAPGEKTIDRRRNDGELRGTNRLFNRQPIMSLQNRNSTGIIGFRRFEESRSEGQRLLRFCSIPPMVVPPFCSNSCQSFAAATGLRALR